MSALGKHILVEFLGCDPERLNDVTYIETNMLEAAEKSGATVINSTFHHFSPFGVSGVIVIQESHLAIHTWPEYQYAALDLFTCGDEVDPWISLEYLNSSLSATNYSALDLRRGSLNMLKRIDFDARDIREVAKNAEGKITMTRDVWFTDKDENQALSLRHSGEMLYDKSSEYQRVRVLDTYSYGKMLTIDNMIMCTERDESHYHEMISHPALFSHGDIKNVLIIGGGDGGTAREILKHNTVKSVKLVEIDENVVEASKEHLPSLSSSFSDSRMEVIIGDGIEFVNKQESGTYDLVVVDGSDPVGPAEGLFSADFYRNCHRILNEGGILVTQSESPYFNSKAFIELNAVLNSIFPREKVKVQLFSIPTYPSGIWSFNFACKGNCNILKINEDYYNTFRHHESLNYYNKEIHEASFSLPNHVKKALNLT
jgi:spermidine synthase